MRFDFVGSVLMASIMGYANAGATIYSSTYVANGSFCVDENARDLFTALNDLRTKGTKSTYYTGFKTACTSVATDGTWTTSSGAKITTTKATAAAALDYVTKQPAVATPLNWSSGLAAAGQKLFDSWFSTGTQGLSDSSGQSSTARAGNYGSLGTSSLAEFGTYAELEYFSVQDAVNALLIAEGDAAGIVRTNLFDSKNTVASTFNGFKDPATANDKRKYFIEFQTARTFTNNANINSQCTVTQNFGGSLCDQTGKSKDFYNAINSIRTNPNTTTNALFKTQLAAWVAGFASSGASSNAQTPMKVNINDDAAIETVNTTEGKTAVDGLITALNAQATAGALKPLAWSAALQNAGKDWIDAVVGSSTIATTVNGTTTASRAAKYGTIATGGAAVYQAIIGQYDFNGLNAVIYLLVDDG